MGATWSCGLFGKASAGLPDDLVIEILLWMPLERVDKFRRLSKFYRKVIESDEFIRKHYDRSIKTKPSVIIRDKYHIGSEFLVDFDPTKSGVTFRKLISRDHNMFEGAKWQGTHFMGCCRGIICFAIVKERSTSWSTDLVFWNPFTIAHRRSYSDYDPPYIEGNKLECTRYLLGYDCSSDDLKVLKIMFYRSQDDSQNERYYQFAVYSSKMNSWRRLNKGLNKDLKLHMYQLHNCMYYDDEVFLEGTNFVHVLVEEFKLGDSLKVLAFDFATENFSLFSLPEHRIRDRRTSIRDRAYALSSLDGCLCFYDSDNCWIMKEYGVDKSWALVFSLGMGSHEYPMPVMFVNNGSQLLLLPYMHYLWLYLCNVEEGELKGSLLFKGPRSSNVDFICYTQHVLYAASRRQP